MPPPFITPHGLTFSWGTTEFHLTSIQVNAQAGSEIDITSMSSEVVSDSQNFRHKKVVPDFDTSISARYGTDIQIEFFAGDQLTVTNFFDCLGSKRLMGLSIPRNADVTSTSIRILTKTAILTQLTYSGSVGQYVTGNATFRVSGM